MPLDVSSLGSLASSLDDLTLRIGRLADDCDDEDDAGIELREVHRQLEASTRRLAAIVRRVGR